MRPLIIFLTIVAVSVSLLAGIVYLSGATFGQRCDKLYPKASTFVKERCVEQLSNGTLVSKMKE